MSLELALAQIMVRVGGQGRARSLRGWRSPPWPGAPPVARASWAAVKEAHSATVDDDRLGRADRDQSVPCGGGFRGPPGDSGSDGVLWSLVAEPFR